MRRWCFQSFWLGKLAALSLGPCVPHGLPPSFSSKCCNESPWVFGQCHPTVSICWCDTDLHWLLHTDCCIFIAPKRRLAPRLRRLEASQVWRFAALGLQRLPECPCNGIHTPRRRRRRRRDDDHHHNNNHNDNNSHYNHHIFFALSYWPSSSSSPIPFLHLASVRLSGISLNKSCSYVTYIYIYIIKHLI